MSEEKDKKDGEEKFNGKWLAGLTFKGAAEKKIKEEGRERVRHTPFERPLTEKDVLGWRVDGAEVVIVAADGRKHRAKK